MLTVTSCVWIRMICCTKVNALQNAPTLKEEVGSVRNKEWFPFDFPWILVIFGHFLSEILGALTSNRCQMPPKWSLTEFLDTKFIISDEINRMAGWKILHLVVLESQSHFVIHKFQNTTIHYIGHILSTLPTSSFKVTTITQVAV